MNEEPERHTPQLNALAGAPQLEELRIDLVLAEFPVHRNHPQ
jgi:hypothetical protein